MRRPDPREDTKNLSLISVSGIGKDTFDVANRLFRGIRGGLGISTVAANAVFAAVTGISIASAAVFTKVAVPEMIRLGHKPRFAVGVVTWTISLPFSSLSA